MPIDMAYDLNIHMKQAPSDNAFGFYQGGTEYEVLAKHMVGVVYARTAFSVIANSAGVLSVINMLSMTGWIIFSCADAASNASFAITSGGVIGQELNLMNRGIGSTVSIRIVFSGCSCNGTLSGNLSCISIRGSAGSYAFMKLVCVADDSWQVALKSGVGAVENPSA
jgi:hypothetical protein